VLLDLHMPGMDGYETALRIRAQPELAGTPIVAVTALAMVGDREAVLARGFDGYMSKPIDPELFVGEIEAVLARKPAASGRGGS
jgi:two-component system cell cycle response regulator